MSTGFITVAPEVSEAVEVGRPVVALESTIFTHGLPRPRNIEVAREAEQIVRDAGAVPATIGVVHGVPTVGLTDEEIVELSHDDAALKSGIRELALGAVNRKNAGTTIAATAFLAHRAGVKVFATGGMGGVHHGASENFDESADLLALAQNPIVLVSAGAKAVLDIHATLERFETLSVPVVGYRTNAYPGFYVTESGFSVAHRVESPEDVAAIYHAQRQLELSTAVLVGNPVPADEVSLERGALLYDVHCSVCHGAQGQADGPVTAFWRADARQPANLTEARMTTMSDSSLYITISQGYGTMPPLRENLTVRERWDVVNYVKGMSQ